MEKTPTVEELINKIDDEFYEKNSYYLSISNPNLFAKTIAIEFAKLHVEAALKEASETATINKNKGQVTGREFGNVTDGSYSINQPSILNIYPRDKIK